MPTLPQLRPWKAIKSGTLPKHELLELLAQKKVSFSTWCQDLLHWTHFPPYQRERQVNFCRFSLDELGLRAGDSLETATERAAGLGLTTDIFMPVYAFELALACYEEKHIGTIVLILPRLSAYSAMYVNSIAAGYRQCVRADQEPNPLEEGDKLAFVLPE